MRKNLLFRFLITYFFTVTLVWFINYLNLIKIDYSDIFIFSFLTSFLYIMFIIDEKIKTSDELIKDNYWRLKNELKKKVNKNNKGKQLLKD